MLRAGRVSGRENSIFKGERRAEYLWGRELLDVQQRWRRMRLIQQGCNFIRNAAGRTWWHLSHKSRDYPFILKYICSAYGCWGRGEGWREKIVKEFGRDMSALLYLRWITNKVLLHNTGNSAQGYVAARMGGGLGEDRYMYKCGWVLPLPTLNYHNTIGRLYSNMN